MNALVPYLTARLREVQERLGLGPAGAADTPFADLVDSMGLVEFIGLIAAECGVPAEVIEQVVNRRFSTIAELAKAMHAARIAPRDLPLSDATPPAIATPVSWLAAWQMAPAATVQATATLDQALGRPAGWLEQHAGITSRCIWADQDPLEAAVGAARACLERAGTGLAALLVTSEAPPRLVGLAALLHARLGLGEEVPALEVGGACTGLLHAFWLGQRLVRPGAAVLVVAVEAPSTWLAVRPGPEGEAAALFGDGAAACLLAAEAITPAALPICDVILGCDARASGLVQVRPGPVVEMDGPALALRAVQHLAAVVRQVCQRHELRPACLEGVFIHAGNARIPALVARPLGVPVERVHVTTAWTGNLGSASLLAALAHSPPVCGPVVCAAVGAGLCWGAALVGVRPHFFK